MIRLQLLDYLATLRQRKTWLAAALLLYATFAMPLALAHPPSYVRDAVSAWFGSRDPFVLFMYMWIDLAMNKAIAFLPAVLASGVVIHERDTGLLPVVASKPLSMPRYFVLRALSVCGVMATLFGGAQLVGAVWFSTRLAGFRAGTFLSAMSLQLFAAVFATALTAALAVWIRRRTITVLVSLGLLGGLVGTALIGFYQPAWRKYAELNPMTLGALSLPHLGALDAGVLLPPMLVLLGLTALAIALGALALRGMEA